MHATTFFTLCLSLLIPLFATGCDDTSPGRSLDVSLDTLTNELCRGASCAPQQTCCSGACVDLSRERAHCGACGVACDAGFVCDQGLCELSCQAGLRECGGVCRDTQSDPLHCGGCDVACAPGEDCADSLCVCPQGFADCNQEPSDGCETSLLSSVEHCGACDSACAGAQATSSCDAGQCQLVCDTDYGDCDLAPGNGCETDVRFDDAHCGACNNACQGAAACQFGLCFGSQQLGTGEAHSCAVLATGQVRCWGKGDLGQLGGGTLSPSLTPVAVLNLTDAVQIAVAGEHTCALTRVGEVVCWGANGAGQLGDGTVLQRSSPTPVEMQDGSRLREVIQISVGREHSCALQNSGAIWCWGENYDGRLGNATKTPSSVPVMVTGLDNAIHISAGGDDVCAVLIDGTVRCWGGNFFGQLTDGTTTDRSSPVDIAGLAQVIQIHAGGGYMCAMLAFSGAKCWGINPRGQLGNNSNADATSPEDVQDLSVRILAMDAGGAHTCAVVAGNTAKCWGSNTWGELGDGVTVLESRVPVDVATISDVVEVSTGSDHTCAMTGDRSVYCWGRNDDGQVGDTTTFDADTPKVVTF